MFGSLTSMPRFFKFKDAVEYYKNTKGVRGRTHVKPLKINRRQPDQYRIAADTDAQGNISAVYCWMYRTPVLVYTPTQLIINGYNSMSTNAFINEVAPHWLRAHQRDNRQIFYIGHNGEFLADTNGKVVINIDPDTYLPRQGEVRAANLNAVVLNRTRAAESRKQCKDVIALAQVTSKLEGYWDALVKSDEVAPDMETAWLKGLLKTGNYRKNEARRWGGGQIVTYEAHYAFGQWGKETEEQLIPAMKKHLYEQMYKQDECYDMAPAPYGVIPKKWRVAE